MNKNLRKAMISAICMLIVGVMSLTGVTYAWFTTTQTAKVEGVNVSVVSTEGGIQLICTGMEKWDYTMTAQDDNAAVDKKSPVSAIKSLTADDKLTFYTATVNDDGTIDTAVDTDGNYFYTDFQMRNPNASTATVGMTGGVIASAIVKNAARWAIVDKDNNTVYFYAGSDANDNTNIGEDKVSDYLAIKGVDTSLDYTTEGEKVAWVALDSVDAFSVTVEPVVYDEATGNVVDENVRSFAIYAWLEGNDSDCENKLAGSSFSVDVKFNTTLADVAE